MFYAAKKEEVAAVALFKHNCTFHGLKVVLSKKALVALKVVVLANLKKKSAEIGEQDHAVLWRRGLIRVANDGEVMATQLGLLAIALAEAGGLINVTAPTEEKVDGVKAK